ncbi:MAG: hypothetical protein ACK4ST_05800, partial [Elioraea tepidiphila]
QEFNGFATTLGEDYHRLRENAHLLTEIAMGATAIGWNGVLLGETARLAPPGQAGAATAMLGVVFALVMLAAPSVFSLTVQATGGYAAGFGLCAVAGVVGALALGPMARAGFTRS